MSVTFEQFVQVKGECACGNLVSASLPTRKEGLASLKILGWQIKLHRKGESTALCPECAERAEKERVRRIAGRILAKQKKVNALAEYQQEMAAMK